MKRIWIFAILAGTACSASAQFTATSASLRIGDTLPGIVFTDMSGKVKHTSLYKGKWLILDCWATWCSPCVAALPKMNALQKQFAGQVQVIAVTTEKAAKVNALFKKNKVGTSLDALLFAVDDTVFTKYFPSRSIPHEVWIDAHGIVRAITAGEYVNAENIQAILRGDAVNWPVKDQESRIKETTALFSNEPSRKTSQATYYSSLLPFSPGASRGKYNRRDSTGNIIYFNRNNFSILALYSFALKGDFTFANNYKRAVLKVKDSTRFIFNRRTGYQAAWRAQNWYCYEAAVPAHYPDSIINRRFKEDLDFFLGLKTRLEKRKVKCLLLTQTTPLRPLTTAHEIPAEDFVRDAQGHYCYSQQNENLSGLVLTLNNDPLLSHLPIVFDATNTDVHADLHLCIGKDPNDVAAWREALKSYGLLLEESIRELEILVIED
jgi:thiol-disulfide isomerase/thioredoxin